VDRTAAIDVLGRLHAAQAAFYAGGPDAPLREVLAAEVEWRVPGRNAIAGHYRGIDAVLAAAARPCAHARATVRGRLAAGGGGREIRGQRGRRPTRRPSTPSLAVLPRLGLEVECGDEARPTGARAAIASAA
jgi:hypothetical protein